MAVEQQSTLMTSSGEQVILIASVTYAGDGSWVTEIQLGNGATVTNRFADEAEARQYPDTLARWLRHGQNP